MRKIADKQGRNCR